MAYHLLFGEEKIKVLLMLSGAVMPSASVVIQEKKKAFFQNLERKRCKVMSLKKKVRRGGIW